ncbi:MAG TPA: flagellar hook-basal body complex protein FliE [Proteobacteria bacterium]|mgnify:CR=1 FL=1|nr:flagellar hook-basal body complex protein FliE [Pseudomonadota bacterium]
MNITRTDNPFTSPLQEMQRLTREAEGLPPASEKNGQPGFSATLNRALNEVNRLQQQADTRINDVSTGRSQDTLGAVVALQQADLSLQFLAQVRNKAIKAYEEIIKMPV